MVYNTLKKGIQSNSVNKASLIIFYLKKKFKAGLVMKRLFDADLDGCRRPLAVEPLTYSRGLSEAKAAEVFLV